MLTRREMVGPWAGLPVAWREDLGFDEDAYRENVARTCRAGVPGVYTGGTTGEFYAMELDEFKVVARATIEECTAGDTPVMIGVTATYTLGAQRRAAYAAEQGADAIQFAFPFWMELTERDLIRFVKEVASACPGLAISLYETTRSKHSLTVEQHRAVLEAAPAYMALKANAGTVGCTPEGCAALSEFVNVWVGEGRWSDLGPHGACGCASSLVYMNPRIILHMFELLQAKRWEELGIWTDCIERLHSGGLAPFTEKGFTDTAYDHLLGRVAGFLTMHPRSRGPYVSATEADVAQLRAWMEANVPELLEL